MAPCLEELLLGRACVSPVHYPQSLLRRPMLVYMQKEPLKKKLQGMFSSYLSLPRLIFGKLYGYHRKYDEV